MTLIAISETQSLDAPIDCGRRPGDKYQGIEDVDGENACDQLSDSGIRHLPVEAEPD